jgi:hypothetical protein
MPKYLNPGRLYLRPNTAVVAALWAMSVGCNLVIMLGCSCELDGRLPHQISAMLSARMEAAKTYADIVFVDTFGDYMRAQKLDRGQPRAFNAARRLREFYR